MNYFKELACAFLVLVINLTCLAVVLAQDFTIDPRIIGLNAFVNDNSFGTISQQFREIKRELGLKHVRVLFHWNDDVQPSPTSEINFSFYDDIIADLPRKMRALVIVTGLPSWMSNPENWINGNPRDTFVELWVRRVIERYRKRRKIRGFQIWNEPNSDDAANATLDLTNSPENYVELLALAHAVIKESARAKLVVSAATTSINQDYPQTFLYNIALKEAGIEEVSDIFAVHYYGEHYERMLLGGIVGFLGTIVNPIWLTESGERGVSNQLGYVSEAWPFLIENIPSLSRIYYYQFTDNTDPSVTYGLRNPSGDTPYSDFYLYLKDLR